MEIMQRIEAGLYIVFQLVHSLHSFEYLQKRMIY